jgi:hypothetical protein
MDNILDMEEQFKEKMLLDKIEELKSEISKLRIALKEAGVDDDLSDISDEEIICVQQILKLKERSQGAELDTDEIKRFDILHKNLKMIRGNRTPKKGDKVKGMSNEELLKELNK